MLILQRKAGESILIGEDIKISIVEIGSDKIKIAVEAPKSVPIVRTELLEAAKINQEAASISQTSLNFLKNILGQDKKPKTPQS